MALLLAAVLFDVEDQDTAPPFLLVCDVIIAVSKSISRGFLFKIQQEYQKRANQLSIRCVMRPPRIQNQPTIRVIVKNAIVTLNAVG